MSKSLLFFFLDDADAYVRIVAAGKTLSATVHDLTAATCYTFRIRNCINKYNKTSDSRDRICNISPPQSACTPSTIPDGQGKPKLKATGPRSITILWSPPAKPNGNITGYSIYRRIVNPNNNAALEDLVFTKTDASPPLVYHDESSELRPHTVYGYKVVVSNEVGDASSEWNEMSTLESNPEEIVDPVVTALSGFAVNVKLFVPGKPNGVVTNYR